MLLAKFNLKRRFKKLFLMILKQFLNKNGSLHLCIIIKIFFHLSKKIGESHRSVPSNSSDLKHTISPNISSMRNINCNNNNTKRNSNIAFNNSNSNNSNSVNNRSNPNNNRKNNCKNFNKTASDDRVDGDLGKLDVTGVKIN